MTEICYAHAPVPVREDLTAAHRRAWQRLAQAGNWWTGAERVAIAAEARKARQCKLCAVRKDALSPHTIEGVLDRNSTLPETAVDVIHRVTTDPRRLTKAWFARAMATHEISDAQYVEIIGEVVAIVSIDSFCWGVGVPLHPLPDPQPGEPSRYRPASAQLEAAWVPMIPVHEAVGAEADLWQVDRTANVIRAMSLVPDAVRQLLDLSDAHYICMENFMDLTWGRSLSRAQTELIAGRVSALRECFY
jgi:alkylhydroperoxidase family enzyme